MSACPDCAALRGELEAAAARNVALNAEWTAALEAAELAIAGRDSALMVLRRIGEGECERVKKNPWNSSCGDSGYVPACPRCQARAAVKEK